MKVVMDLTDKTANFAFTHDSSTRYCGINGFDRINEPCLFSLVNYDYLILDNDGLPANYMSALYASEDGNPAVNFYGCSLKFVNFFQCIIERVKYLAAAKIDSVILLVPFKSDQIHKWNIKHVLMQEGVYNVEFVPYCIAAALGYVGTYGQALKDQDRSFTFMVFNADYPFCDCATFRTVVKNKRLGISFIKASHYDEFACMSMDSMIYTKLTTLLNQKLVSGRSRIVKKQFNQRENEIIKQIDHGNFTIEGLIRLYDIEDYFKEGELESVFDEDDVCYDGGEFIFSDEYISRCQYDIYEKVCSIIEHQLNFNKSNGYADADAVLGFGRLLDRYRGLAHDINMLLQKHYFRDLTELKPADRFALLGARYFKDYELSREYRDTITLFNNQLGIDDDVIEQNTVVSFRYTKRQNFIIPSHVTEFKCGIREGNSFKLVVFPRLYFYHNRYLTLQFELYSFAATYSIMLTWGDEYSLPEIFSYYAENSRCQHGFSLTKNDLATVVQVLVDCGCIFYDHLATDVEHSPHDLLRNIKLIGELLGKDELEVKVLCQLYNLKYDKMSWIRERLAGFDISEYIESAALFDDLSTLLEQYFSVGLYRFEFYENIKLKDVLTCVGDQLNFENKALDLRFSCVISLGCLILKLSDDFPLFLSQNSSTEIVFCCYLPVVATTYSFYYLLQLMYCSYKLDSLDEINYFILFDRGNSGFLIYHSGFTLDGVKQTQYLILSAVNLLPCFGQALLTFFNVEDLGKETLAEIIADGCKSYKLDAYDVKIMYEQIDSQDPEEQFYPYPFIYNLTWELVEWLCLQHNLLLERATLRLALSYSSKHQCSGIMADTGNALIVECNSQKYAKMFLLSHYPIAEFKPIRQIKELSRSRGLKKDLTTYLTRYPTLSQQKESTNAVVYCITCDVTIGTHTLAVKPFVEEINKNDSLQRPELKLQLESKVLNLGNEEIELPYVPLGYLFYEVGFEQLKNVLEEMNRTALTLSRKAPCCIQHYQRAVDHYIDKQNDPFYQSCPVRNCNLLFCLNCYTWHEYVKPLDRQCVSGFIFCPRCNYKGFYDKNACYIIKCRNCGCFFCLFPYCSKSFKTYKNCEDHVFSHGKGIGKFERGDANDLLVDAEHI